MHEPIAATVRWLGAATAPDVQKVQAEVRREAVGLFAVARVIDAAARTAVAGARELRVGLP